MAHHVLNSEQFDREDLEKLFVMTDTIRKYGKNKEGVRYLKSLLPHKRAMLYFTQPSTRTFLSFFSACQTVGMDTIEIRNPSTSSTYKGESEYDSIRTFSSYVDLIVMRSPESTLCKEIAEILDQTPRAVPVINAGSGTDEHPTQAILDVYTLYRAFKDQGALDGKTVTFVGDVKRGRTIHSLAIFLGLFQNTKLIFCSPDAFKMEETFRKKLVARKINFEETNDFEAAISVADAVYMTRVQDEYDLKHESRNIDFTKYYFEKKHLDVIQKHTVILHPFPRRQELSPEIDHDPRARYWRQERNGMWTRAALITEVLNHSKKIMLPNV